MIEFINAIREQDLLLIWAIYISLVAGAFVRYARLRHQRWIRVSISGAVLILLFITLWIQGVMHMPIAAMLILTIGIPSASWLYATAYKRRPLGVEKRAIDSLAEVVRAGNYTLANQQSAQRPFYLVSVPAKLEWSFLRVESFVYQQRFKESYEPLVRLASLPLFEEERVEVEVKRASILYWLGDTIRARRRFEYIKDAIPEQADRLFLEALLVERNGGLGLAREHMLHALGEAQQQRDARLARIYNNLGRIEGILKNRTDALHYYKKAATLAGELGEKGTIHTAYQNLVDTLLLGGDYGKAQSVLEEYTDLVDRGITYELLRLYNYHLEYARQTEDPVFFLKTLALGRARIASSLSLEERLIFESSELRIRWNNRSWKTGWEEMLFVVDARLDDYLALDFPQQYHALKEIFIVLKELFKSNQLGPFAAMFDRLVRYMQEIDTVIEGYLLELPDYCVFERCEWEKERVWLRRLRDVSTRDQYIVLVDQMIEHLRNIKDTHLQHGNPLKATEADLNIADEAMSHVVHSNEEFATIRWQPIVEQRTVEAAEAIQEFDDHPQTVEYKLRVARYALFLGDRNRAQQYFEAFKDAGVSIHHYASWLQEYYQDLEQSLGAEEKIEGE